MDLYRRIGQAVRCAVHHCLPKLCAFRTSIFSSLAVAIIFSTLKVLYCITVILSIRKVPIRRHVSGYRIRVLKRCESVRAFEYLVIVLIGSFHQLLQKNENPCRFGNLQHEYDRSLHDRSPESQPSIPVPPSACRGAQANRCYP